MTLNFTAELGDQLSHFDCYSKLAILILILLLLRGDLLTCHTKIKKKCITIKTILTMQNKHVRFPIKCRNEPCTFFLHNQIFNSCSVSQNFQFMQNKPRFSSQLDIAGYPLVMSVKKSWTKLNWKNSPEPNWIVFFYLTNCFLKSKPNCSLNQI